MLHRVENQIKKEIFHEYLSRERTTHRMTELIIAMGDINGHVNRNIDGFQGEHGGFSIGTRNQEGRMLLEFCILNLCIANTWFRKADNEKITYGS